MRRALLVLGVAACARRSPPAPPPALEFRLVPPPGAPPVVSAALPGSFNGWSTTATPLVRAPDGSWSVRVPAAGRHEFKLHVNGAWVADMCDDATWGDPSRARRVGSTAACAPDGHGGRNAVVELGAPPLPPGVGLAHDPADPAHVSAAGGRLSVRFAANAGRVRSATLRADGAEHAMHRQLAHDGREVWRATLPEGTTRWTIVVTDDAGRTRTHGPHAAPPAPFRAVEWVGDAVGYQVFPERFANGDPSNDALALATDDHALLDSAFRGAPPERSAWDAPPTARHCCHQYYGGDLRGVIDRLGHLDSLGVTLLYLNPFFLAGSAHGYDVWDHRAVDPALGDTATLRALLDAARARGMRVLWDFVPNHVGVGHPAFRDAAARGATSPTWTWFRFRVAPESVRVGNAAHYDTFAGAGALPKLDVARPAVRADLLATVERWQAFGFAGLRVDVPEEVIDGPAFLAEVRRAVKARDPDAYLVGESWRRAPEWVRGDRFDALMNYAVGQDVVERFARGDLAARDAAAALSRVLAEYPEASAAMAFNVIATHDNARLLTKLGGGGLGDVAPPAALARQRLASAMLYALPGVPVTFQGDECGFLGAGGGGTREENRFPVQWGRCDAAMFAHYRRLGALRRALPGLRAPALRLLSAEGAVLAWARGEPGAPDEVVAAFNAGDAAGAAPIPPGDWTDAVSGENVRERAALAPLGWRLLRRP
ncbi:alpha-amylase family glycosyl hydrolase [Roseisolibacter sp. H3M3-2]|uniref:alpha-amylase family glycosyl hydrolase n=1 Tax=Roseisolibacter sp. H3M3-2 TaxID=3031323 RepID=UPI0023D9EF34|nr:alpha-amylase family glycosyl hydrolase [Roseisolibacter sp. H3M3-2]MDF1504518.1 alpha-amylase family glycosyl hydrolase [Roseisolibacter sp. H3M3-2]